MKKWVAVLLMLVLALSLTGCQTDPAKEAAKVVAEVNDAKITKGEAESIYNQMMTENEPEEKAAFLEDLGIAESGLDRLIRASYDLLGLISFLTAGPKEVRAWTIKKGTKAPGAAGKIHSDFERGFIRAEIVAFDDLMRCGSMLA